MCVWRREEGEGLRKIRVIAEVNIIMNVPANIMQTLFYYFGWHFMNLFAINFVVKVLSCNRIINLDAPKKKIEYTNG